MNKITDNIDYINTASEFSVAIIVGMFYEAVANQLKSGAINQLLARGCLSENILLVEVPGAVEIPIAAQRVAMLQKFNAIIVLGAVIRGETGHYDYVCQQVS